MNSDSQTNQPAKPEASEVFADKPKEDQPWDVAIIGSGPAGFSAAIYTTRGAASTVILGGDNWGGQLMLTTEVDNYLGLPGMQGPEMMEKFKSHATKFGGEFVAKNVSSVDFSQRPFKLTADKKEYLAKTVIIATGSETKWLGVPGEDKLRGRGVSSCAPCDAPFFKDKKVIVVGGGDSAMEEALVLTKYASSVTIIHRREEFSASAAMQERVFTQEKEGKIDIVWNSEVKEFVGEAKLEKVKLVNNKENNESEMDIDGAFVAIGHLPATDLFKGKVELDKKGYVVKHQKDNFSTATSVEGIFVAGDVHDHHYMQAVTAAGFGCMAAMDTLKFIDKEKERNA